MMDNKIIFYIPNLIILLSLETKSREAARMCGNGSGNYLVKTAPVKLFFINGLPYKTCKKNKF